MKIGFVLDERGQGKIAYTWSEIKSLKGNFAFSRECFLKFKAIENNTFFWKEIIKSRANLNIPKEGLTWEKTRVFLEKELKDTLRRDGKPHEEEFVNFNKEIERINKILILNKPIRGCLEELICSNYISHNPFFTDESEIDYRFDDYAEDRESGIPDSVLVSIQYPITKNKLVQYINKNWSGIRELLNDLPNKKTFKISERDLKIFEIKTLFPNKTFSDIADDIVREFNIDDPDSKINEFSVKEAYKRARIKISSLAKPRKQ